MQINTQQLRTALQTAANTISTGHEQPTGGVKVENLNLKNVYIGSKGEVHVSDKGWSRMWAGLMGRKTGSEALAAGMKQHGIPEKVIERAMSDITRHQGAHSEWVQKHDPLAKAMQHQLETGMGRNAQLQTRLDAGKSQEPSLNLENLIKDAHTSELPTAGEKNSPAAAGEKNSPAAAEGTKKAPDPFRAGRTQGLQAAAILAQDKDRDELVNAKVDEKLRDSGLSDSDQSKLRHALIFHARDQARSESSPLYPAIRDGIAKEVRENGLKVLESPMKLTDAAREKALEYAGAAIDQAIKELTNPPEKPVVSERPAKDPAGDTAALDAWKRKHHQPSVREALTSKLPMESIPESPEK